MSKERERLSVAEALHLHDDRIKQATKARNDAQILLRKCESWEMFVIQARDTFKKSIKEKP